MQEQQGEAVFVQVWNTVIARNCETYELTRTKLVGSVDTKLHQAEAIEGLGRFEARLRHRMGDDNGDFSNLREAIQKRSTDLYVIDELMKKADIAIKSLSHFTQLYFVVDSRDCFDDYACCLLLANWLGNPVTVISSRACAMYLQHASNVLVAAELSLFPQDWIGRFRYRFQVVSDLGENANKLQLCEDWNRQAGAPTSRLSSVLQAFYKIQVNVRDSLRQTEGQKVLLVGAWFEPEKTRKLIKRTGLFLDLSFIEYSSIVDFSLEPETRFDCIMYKVKSQTKFKQLADYVEKQKAAGKTVLLSNDLESFEAFRKRELGIDMLRKLASSEQVQRALNPEELEAASFRRVRVPQTVKLSLVARPSIEVAASEPESDRVVALERHQGSIYRQVAELIEPHSPAAQRPEQLARRRCCRVRRLELPSQANRK